MASSNQTNDTQTTGVSRRSKRKPTPTFTAGEEEDEDTVVPERKRIRRSKKIAENNNNEKSTPKEFLAEGSEGTYRTNVCPECRRCFTMRSHLNVHLRLHFPDPGLQCPHCQRHFTSKSKLRVHLLREAGEKSHRCDFCDYCAVDRSSVRRHMTAVHADEVEDGAESFPCPTCAQVFRRSGLLKTHMKTHSTEETEVVCFHEGCSFQSSEHKLLSKHMSDEHQIHPVRCRHHTCAAVFPDGGSMEAHYQTHLAYHCPHCDFSCSNKSTFLQHKRHGHPGADRLTCGFCAFVTFNPVEFQQHMGHMHASEKIHGCSQCDYVTSHKRGLKRHMQQHTAEKPHKCSRCDFRCRDVYYLSKHMLTHSDAKKFMCSECGYVTKWRHCLSVHMRKHTGDLRYQCDQCPYRAYRLDQLKSHKLRHQGKSLICEVCAYACKRKPELRNHMLAKHSEEGKEASSFKCKYCAYSTCHQQALRNHENCKHTKHKEYQCALCSYSTFSSVGFFLHKKKAHGYVPGDKVWLENYRAKEKERSSRESSQAFYSQPSVDPEEPSQNTTSEDPNGNEENPDPNVLDVVCQEIVDDRSPSGNSPEYCTLVLTALPTTDYPTHSLPDESSEAVGENFEVYQTEQSSLVEEDASDTSDSQGHRDAKQYLEDPSTRLVENVGSPEGTLIDARKRDRDQADSMVKEGRVQMLVVPPGDFFRCEQCPFVGRSEEALKSHRSSCRGRKPRDEGQISSGQVKDQETSSAKNSNPRQVLVEDASQDNSVQLEGGINSEQTIPTTQNEIGSNEVGKADLTNSSTELTLDTSSQSRPKQINLLKRRPYTRVKSNLKKIPSTDADDSREDAIVGNKKSLVTIKPQTRLKSNQHVVLKTSKPFSCPHCPFTTKRRYVLENHKTVHTRLGRFGCDSCAKTFGTTTLLSRHKSRIHDKRPTQQCPLCEYCAYTSFDLKRHELRCHTGDLRQVCTHCKARFSSQFALRNHCNRAHQPQTLFPCEQCDHICGTEEALKNHQQHKHSQLRCSSCQESFPTKEHLEVHRKTHLAHRCQLCPFASKTAMLLAKHLSDEHEDGSSLGNTLKCSRCEFSSGHQLVMEQHLRSHGGKRLYKCTECKYSTWNKQKITWHIRIHTGEKPYSCDQCRYTCADPSRLKLHKRVHQEERMYLCPECGYKCKWATQLKYHMTKHTGEKPHACDECDYRTNRADALRAHKDTQHCDDRLYICEKCGKSFKTSFLLKTHQRQHTGGRAYTCGRCGKSFRWPAGLRHHYLSHTNQLPFGCTHCSYKAKQKFQVIKHLLKHHPGVTVEEGVMKDTETSGLTLREALQGVRFEQPEDGIGENKIEGQKETKEN